MPRKIDLLQEVYQTQLATLTYSREVWCSFLRTAAFQYKYSFPDQVLIWSQRPHARACAELELWNKVFDRWVNRHAKGIALIKDKGSYTGIRYVFDVADTHGRHGEELKLWQVRNGYHDDVTEALENRFGELEDDSSFVTSVISACQNAVEDNMTDYLSDLSHLTENSALQGMDEDNLKVRLRSILISSVAYTVLTRIGEDSDMFLDFDAFDDLRFYNTAETINLLGNATRDISEVCLREIERTVKNCEKENRTFDEKKENEYNKTETEKQNHRQEEKEYGRIESDLPQGTERDAVSRSETAGADALPNRQVRRPAASIPEGAQEGNLHNAADAVPAEQPSARDRADGEDDAFAPYEADGREPWGERADESGKSDALGAGDEQHQSIGGGDGSERPDIHLNRKQPRNYLDGDDLIKILKHGDELAHSKQDIVLFLSQEKDEERKNQYIRECYKPMTVSIYKDEAHSEYIGYSSLFDDGLHLFEGTFLNPKAEMSFSWQTTRELIEALVKDNNYLDEPVPETLAKTTVIEKPEPVKQNFAVSQEVIDGFLRLGGCTSRSNYRIYGFYRRANNKEENIRFLRAEYETDAIGLIVNGQRCAVSWDENGVTFAMGESVATAWRKSTLSWSEIDDRIRQLIELGQYISKDEVSSAVAVYDKSVAEKVTNVYRDFLRDAEFPENPPQNDYQKQVIFFFATLHEPGRAEPFIPVFEKAVDALTGEARRREGYTPQFVKMLVSSYRRDPVEYPQEEYVLPPEHYLSQDQIDNNLIRSGSHVSEGKFRIYSFFLRNKNKQERAKFLSDEYGIGGSYGGRQDESHDSKGLALAGGLDKNGVRNVLLSWAQVANRIDELIRSNRYLTAKEVEHLDAYEKEQIARRIVNFYYGKSAEAPRPFEKKDEDYFGSAAEKEVYQQLGDAERVNEIIGMMQTVFDSEMPRSRTYDHDRESLADVRQFAEGKYNLFPGSKYRKKEQVIEAPRIIQPIETGQEERPSDIDFSQYGLNLKLGDWLHIGQGEVQLSSATADGVELYDGTLFPMEMTLAVFVRRVKENPLNEAFLHKESEAVVNEPMPAPVAPNEPEQEEQVGKHEIAAYALGDFYEFFDEDAKRTAEICDLTMTTRAMADGTRHPMCGVPKYTIDRYEQKLKEAGYTVVLRDFKEFNADRQATPEPDKDIPTEEHIFLDSTREELYWIYYNPDSDAGGQLVTNTLSFSVFREAYEDFVSNGGDFTDKGQRDAFIDSISEMADCELADERTPFFAEAMATFDTEPDYTGFTAENLSTINREIEGYMVDMEAERAGDAYEAEYGADGYRMFPGNAPEADSEEAAMPTLQEEKPKPKKTITTFHPEIPLDEKHDFRITDNDLGVGGAKEKYRRNIAAIRLLHTLEDENRIATPEEQQILSEYTGWGGLPDAFDENKDSWAQEYRELSELLTPAEYAAARESTLTAFYTPPVVIKAIYKALENMGFARGNILEPSCGVGNFMGLVPESMSESRFYGVELDSISGRIAQQLYQKQNISVTGFENTAYPDSFFDVAIGNVPFGQFKVQDKRYDRNNFLIHDFFFAKALDQVRPGGVIAFITSKGTLDKQNPPVRRYIAARADFLGAIRLPDTTFKASAGTEAVADIIFLQKRDRMVECDPDWCHLGKDENGIEMNQYFVEHPDMVLGSMVTESGPFGPQTTCKPFADMELSELLSEAVSNIHAEVSEIEQDELTGEESDGILPADPSVRNFSFALVNGKVYYRENSIMKPVETSMTGENRIKGMIAIRDTVRELIDAQLENYPDSAVHALQQKLNEQYDRFTAKYGLLGSRGNASAFDEDNAYFLLCSLEKLDEEGNLKEKADIFTKRTINPCLTVDRVDTASEALAVSLGEHAFVDMDYMSELTGKSEAEILADLRGVIFLNPLYGSGNDKQPKYLPADEYLSGNVREKLTTARRSAEQSPDDYAVNVEALERVQPKDLTASEIGVRLGSTWIPPEDIQAFVFELLEIPYYYKYRMQVKFEPITGQWRITDKSYGKGNVKATSVYGTSRVNAYNIIEDSLNLKDVRVFDYIEDENGNKKAVLNKKETTIAQGKQEEIRRKFEEWIWKGPNRRERLCKLYNEKFNSIRPREFSGKHIRFYGMSPEIKLRDHQADAVARILYGGNTLLAHVVGAGKTFTMVAAAQESKRLGLCSKSMFVVPNHLINQWASEYLQLYPSANILVATKKDFETKNRKKFCARIATGDYDAIIIGHSQFEKIPMSIERQTMTIQAEIDEILASIDMIKNQRGERFTIKQLEKTKKQLQLKLDKLNDRSRKDDVVTFEQLGVDRLFVDEAHFYKNLAAYTKMRNVAGISQTEAQKSSDLYMKCRYLDEITGGKGVTFATGTPISNTMVELYTMQKYLQYDALKEKGLTNFDAWASTFGETVTAIELDPTGTGYRAKTRFAKFFNIPELMAMFKEVADVQTADMLNLPVPMANFHVEKEPSSEIQKEMVQSFADRAAKVHSHMVSSDEDNMLLITNDGRKAALDQRLLNPDLPDFEESKVNHCVRNVVDIWKRTAEQKSAQLVFCDLSTPHHDGKFNVYDDIRKKLIEEGIPESEIAFIHDADTDAKKKDLFSKVRSGQVRVLMGSTFKMGAGTNVQERLIALHDLDVPWRPSDLEQRLGRIVRQGNSNPEVEIYRYVTEGTFDAYMYQLLESKQKFISQIMTSKSPVRCAEDVDDTALSYAEIKALASGNPKIMEKMQLDADVAKLKLQKSAHLSERYMLEDQLFKDFPKEVSEEEERIAGYGADIEIAKENTHKDEKGFSPMIVQGKEITVKAEAGKAILAFCKKMTNPDLRPLGEYRGFKTEIGFDILGREFFMMLRGKLGHRVTLGQDANGIITRLDNAIDSFFTKQCHCKERLSELKQQIENAKREVATPFPREEELTEKLKRLDELNAELNMDKPENELVDGERDGDETSSESKESRPENDRQEREQDDERAEECR